MNHQNETFRDQRIELHGKSFHNCTFDNCELVFDGDRPPTFTLPSFWTVRCASGTCPFPAAAASTES